MAHKIQIGSRYDVDEETGTLTIFDAKIEDTAKYVCQYNDFEVNGTFKTFVIVETASGD